MSVYTANVSSVQDYMQCRFRWVLKWVENRVPFHESPALAEGKLLHLIFEDHARGICTMKEAIEHHCRLLKSGAKTDYERYTAEKAVTGIMDRAEALEQWTDKWDWTIPCLEVEEKFEIVHPYDDSIHLLGRPDRVGVMGHELYHIQHRGLMAQMNFSVYTDLAKRHYHEHLYAVALHAKYPQYKYGGTMFNLVRKLKYRTNVGKKNEAVKTLDQMFYQPLVLFDLESPLHENVMHSLLGHIHEMRRTEAEYRHDGTMPSPNEKMNGGFSGSSIDPYFRVLTGEASLEDDTLFKSREDTYAVADASEGD